MFDSDMIDNAAYSEILALAQTELLKVATTVEIRGDGLGRFLTARKDEYGIEFYAGQDVFIIDPALGGELQGERDFGAMEEALRFASRWLARTT